MAIAAKDIFVSKIQTTGIGSLPYHNVDAAIKHAFETRIPFLPQLPMRYPSEYMIVQALDGLPGLMPSEDGLAVIDLERWNTHSKAFSEQLKNAQASQLGFEPTPNNYRAWMPFLWELTEQKRKIAKMQIAGPLTSQWSVKLSNGSPLSRTPELGSQIFQIVLLKAQSMIHAFKEQGITPILFLDEPGLYALNPEEPQHVVLLKELSITIAMLKKSGALVGIHCCSDTRWDSVLKLGFDFLSLDTHLSLPKLLKPEYVSAIEEYLSHGGRFAFGVIPTGRVGQFIPELEVKSIYESFKSELQSSLPKHLPLLLRESLYTPACGLALHPPDSANHLLDLLEEFARLVEKDIST